MNEIIKFESTIDVVDCRVLLICLVMKFDDTEIIDTSTFKIDHLEIREQRFIGEEPNGYNLVPADDPIIEKIRQKILDGHYDYELKYKALETILIED